jgi:hypothetical protein
LAAALIVVLDGEGGRADRMWVWLKLPNPENCFYKTGNQNGGYGDYVNYGYGGDYG